MAEHFERTHLGNLSGEVNGHVLTSLVDGAIPRFPRRIKL